MIVAIADTPAIIWYLFSDPRLGKAASTFIDATIAARDHIGVSAISIVEMVYLIEKGRFLLRIRETPSTSIRTKGAISGRRTPQAWRACKLSNVE